MKISIEVFTSKYWETQIRYYSTTKNLNDFDLFDIPNKRRNAKIL